VKGCPITYIAVVIRGFLEEGKKRLTGDTSRKASSHEVSDLKKENEHLKQLLAEVALKH
jgi:transposase